MKVSLLLSTAHYKYSPTTLKLSFYTSVKHSVLNQMWIVGDQSKCREGRILEDKVQYRGGLLLMLKIRVQHSDFLGHNIFPTPTFKKSFSQAQIYVLLKNLVTKYCRKILISLHCTVSMLGSAHFFV